MLKRVAVLLLAFAAAGMFANAAHAAPVHVSGAVASKLEKHRVGIDPRELPPPYAARGTVKLRFTVTPAGTVTDIRRTVPSVGVVQKALESAATKCLSQWTYNPYLVKGNPTAMRVVIEFHFQVRRWDATYP
jgi:TonB family protein